MKQSLKLIPAVIYIKDDQFEKYFSKNYVFLEKKGAWLKVGTWIPVNTGYDDVKCFKPTDEQLKLIKLL